MMTSMKPVAAIELPSRCRTKRDTMDKDHKRLLVLNMKQFAPPSFCKTTVECSCTFSLMAALTSHS
jgi:hypothetical protein